MGSRRRCAPSAGATPARRPAPPPPHERRRRTRAAPSLLRHASAIASRYKHFALLDQLLVQEFGSLVPSQALPGKRAFGNLQPQFVEERKAALARYLQLCISTREIASSSIFCNFVEADKYSGQFQREQLAAPAASLSTEIGRIGTKQGYLLKQGRRLASWKRRYFCLCEANLFYYYSAEMSNPFQPLGVVVMSGTAAGGGSKSSSGVAIDQMDRRSPSADVSSSSPPPPGGGGGAGTVVETTVEPLASCALPERYAFAVHTPERTWYLAADSEFERDAWVGVLCRAGAILSAGSTRPPAAAWVMPASGGGGGEGVGGGFGARASAASASAAAAVASS